MANVFCVIFLLFLACVDSRKLGRRTQAATVVEEPTVVINPLDGESYLILTDPGEEAIVYFSKDRGMFQGDDAYLDYKPSVASPIPQPPPAAANAFNVKVPDIPVVQQIVTDLGNMPNNPLLSDSKEAQMALHLMSKINQHDPASKEAEIQTELLTLLLEKLAGIAPTSSSNDNLLESLLAKEVINLKHKNDKDAKNQEELAGLLLAQYIGNPPGYRRRQYGPWGNAVRYYDPRRFAGTYPGYFYDFGRRFGRYFQCFPIYC